MLPSMPPAGRATTATTTPHILRTTRKVEADGLGAKLDTEKAGRKRSDDLEAVRAKWADLTNERLRENGIAARVDHRSLEAQGIDREPTQHLGPAASGYERRTGQPSDKRIQQEREAVERLARAKALGELERQSRQSDRLILDLSGDLSAAKSERDRQPRAGSEAGRSLWRGRLPGAVRGREAGRSPGSSRRGKPSSSSRPSNRPQQRQAELAKEQAAQALAKQREEAERKQQAERETKKPERDGPGWSR
jgi:hypothetical protein